MTSLDLLSAGVILLILTLVVWAVTGSPPEYFNNSESPSFSFNSNIENLTLDVNFNGSGLAIMKKIGDKLNENEKIINRLFTIKNIIKKYIYSPKPKS